MCMNRHLQNVGQCNFKCKKIIIKFQTFFFYNMYRAGRCVHAPKTLPRNCTIYVKVFIVKYYLQLLQLYFFENITKNPDKNVNTCIGY